MRKFFSLFIKLFLVGFFFSQTLFLEGLRQLLHFDSDATLYQTIVDISDTIQTQTKDIDLTKGLVLANHYTEVKAMELVFELPPYNNVEILPDHIIPQAPNPSAVKKPYQNIKRIYIYNTHQMEEYLDKNTVMEATLYLANKLRKGGMIVDIETNNFVSYARTLGLDYNGLYQVSRHYLAEKLKTNKYDLIIDLHRDSLKREQTFVTLDGKNYARLMIVIGTLSPHFDGAYYKAATLSDNINQTKQAIMKPVYKQYARYNQDFQENMMLLEVGSNQNYYEEVLNSLDVFAKSLLELKGD